MRQCLLSLALGSLVSFGITNDALIGAAPQQAGSAEGARVAAAQATAPPVAALDLSLIHI